MHEELTPSGFARLVAAGTPLLHIATGNEARTEALLAQGAQALKEMPAPFVWDCLVGFPGQSGTTEPLAALRWATGREGRGIFLFKDLHWFWRDSPPLQRLLREFAGGRGRSGKSLVFLGSRADLPPALTEEFVLLEHALPGREEILAWFEARRQQDPWLRQQLTSAADLAQLVVAGQGLDLPEIERALRLARVTPGEGMTELVNALHQAKKQRLRRSGIMEFVDNEVLPEHLGGMENLKAWMEKRERAFGPAGFAAGRHQPKGVLLMGVSGCGKSLFVKAIAARWRLPLVRLDMATVYEGTFGSPEATLRQACHTAEALAPCVLWIDEMEAGITTHGFKADGGSASRVLGYFLTWMQEKRRPVFVAATANAIEMLPAEVLRKGRFDEIFYISLPAIAEREEIFRIHLRQRGFDPDRYVPAMLAHSAKGFSGAEIEQAVESASFEALAQERPLTQQDLMEAISRTVPLSVTMAEQIKKIEAWAFKRAVPASKGGSER